MSRRIQHYRGGKGEWGFTLKELEEIVAHAKEIGYDPERTRVCSAVQRDKGLVDIFFVEQRTARAGSNSSRGQWDAAGVV